MATLVAVARCVAAATAKDSCAPAADAVDGWLREFRPVMTSSARVLGPLTGGARQAQSRGSPSMHFLQPSVVPSLERRPSSVVTHLRANCGG